MKSQTPSSHKTPSTLGYPNKAPTGGLAARDNRREHRVFPMAPEQDAAREKESGHYAEPGTAGNVAGDLPRAPKATPYRVKASGDPVTAVEPYPAAEEHGGEPGQDSQRVPSHPGPPAWAARVLRRQILGIISDVIYDPDTEPQVRQGLQQHLDDNPGRPERAMLAHLRDWQAREDRPRE